MIQIRCIMEKLESYVSFQIASKAMHDWECSPTCKSEWLHMRCIVEKSVQYVNLGVFRSKKHGKAWVLYVMPDIFIWKMMHHRRCSPIGHSRWLHMRCIIESVVEYVILVRFTCNASWKSLIPLCHSRRLHLKNDAWWKSLCQRHSGRRIASIIDSSIKAFQTVRHRRCCGMREDAF